LILSKAVRHCCFASLHERALSHNNLLFSITAVRFVNTFLETKNKDNIPILTIANKFVVLIFQVIIYVSWLDDSIFCTASLTVATVTCYLL